MQDLMLQLTRKGTLLEFRGRPDNDFLTLSQESAGKTIYDILPSDVVHPVMKCIESALQTGDLQSFEYQPPMGGRCYELRFIPGKDERVSLIISNISDYKQAAEKVKYLSHHDTLTDLPNRYLFHDRLTQAIAYAEREKQMLAIVFLDIDNFKQINDTIGHKVGDQLLQGIADRLMIAMRKTDSIFRLSPEDSGNMVARLGGDEFTILLNDVRNIRDPAKAAQRILNVLSEPFVVGALKIFVTASIGIAVYPLDGKDIDTLLMNADVAMYQAKSQSRNSYQYYSESMNSFAIERFTVENKLRQALQHNEFMLFYQPQVDISTGGVIGVEALIRWLQPDLVLIKPGQFIPLAEETGLIIPIGEWVLRTACAEHRVWQKAGLTPLRVTVNVSGIQFRQNNFIEIVSGILRDTGFDPKFLQLELTESTIMQDSDNVIKKLHSLRDMGIQVAIDDFGTGYSSLSYLKRFPLSTLKIDYSFIKDIVSSANDRAIVSAIVNLAHNFNLRVIAEGVEKRKQLDFLRTCRCEGVQGYLICPPVNSVVLAEFVKKKKYLEVLGGSVVKK
jgi:diguanylate cyclase (GGDEF)-like protein